MENKDVVDTIIDRMLSEKKYIDLTPSAAAIGVAHMIKALGCLGDPKAVGPIIGILDGERGNPSAESIQQEGLDALGKIGGEEAMKSIISYFDYEEFKDRALSAIIRIGSSSIETLAVALESDNTDMKINALRALGNIGDKAAIEHIAPLLKDDDVVIAGLAAIAIAMCK
jgi:HEAT repeat protein